MYILRVEKFIQCNSYKFNSILLNVKISCVCFRSSRNSERSTNLPGQMRFFPDVPSLLRCVISWFIWTGKLPLYDRLCGTLYMLPGLR